MRIIWSDFSRLLQRVRSADPGAIQEFLEDYGDVIRRDVRRNIGGRDRHLADQESAANSRSRAAVPGELLQAALGKLSAREALILKWRQEGVAWASIANRLRQNDFAEALRKQHQRALSRLARELGIDEETP